MRAVLGRCWWCQRSPCCLMRESAPVVLRRAWAVRFEAELSDDRVGLHCGRERCAVCSCAAVCVAAGVFGEAA
eukprot:11898861-Alexandrium_andersonii.AAC.1